MRGAAKYLRTNLLAPAHDTNRRKGNPLRRGRPLLLMKGAPLNDGLFSGSHLHPALTGLLVVLILPLRVPPTRARARGETLHMFELTGIRRRTPGLL